MKIFEKWGKDITGDDLDSFLVLYLNTTNPGKKILSSLDLPRSNSIIENIQTIYEKSNHWEKHRVICPLVSSEYITRRYLNEKGFNIGETSYTSSNQYFTKISQKNPPKEYQEVSAERLLKKRKINEVEPLDAEQPLSLPQKNNKRKTDDIELFCICQQQNDETKQMIRCDKCRDWFHLECMNLKKEDIPQGKWFCGCQNRPAKVQRTVDLSCEDPFQILQSASPEKIPISPIKYETPSKLFSSPLNFNNVDSNLDFDADLNVDNQVELDVDNKEDLSEDEDLLQPVLIPTNHTKQVMGLRRHGQTCYIISILQLFLNNSSLQNMILNLTEIDPQTTQQKKIKKKIIQENKFKSLFKNLIKQKLQEHKTYFDPKYIVHHIVDNSTFTIENQADAQELLNFFCNIIDPNFKNFTLKLNHVTECQGCKVEINDILPTYETALEILPNRTIQDLFDEYLKRKKGEDFYCSTCEEMNSVEHYPQVTQQTKVLFIHLKRFSYDQQTGNFKKKRDSINLQETIQVVNALYDLQAVVMHIGGDLTHGHYVNFSKIKNNWFKINDSQVTQVEVDQVFEETKKDCYLLVFNQKDIQHQPAVLPEKYQVQTKLDEPEDDIVDDLDEINNYADPYSPSQDSEESEDILPNVFPQLEPTIGIPPPQPPNFIQSMLQYSRVYSEVSSGQERFEFTGNNRELKDALTVLDTSNMMCFEGRDVSTPDTCAGTTMNMLKLQKKIEDLLKKLPDSSFNDSLKEITPDVTLDSNALRSMFDQNWYADSIIELYFDRIQHFYRRTTFFGADFTKRVSNSDLTDPEIMEKFLKQIEKKMEDLKNNIIDQIFLPININTTHWVLGVITREGFTIFDPMCDKDVVFGKEISQFNLLFSCHQYQQATLQKNVVNPGISHQTDAYNCGVYTCFYAHALAENDTLEFIFSQDSSAITYFRNFIALHICNCFKIKKLLKENIAHPYRATADTDVEIIEHQKGGAATDIHKLLDEDETLCHKYYHNQENHRDTVFEASKKKKRKFIYKCHLHLKQDQSVPCNFTTEDSSNMKRHLNGHANYKPYACTECSKTFTQSCALKFHLEQVHKIKTVVHTEESTKGRRPLPIEITNKINAFLIQNSTESSEVYMDEDGTQHGIRYISTNFSYLWRQFIEDPNNPQISRGTFKKRKLPVFKKTKRRTDVCTDCAKEPYLKRDLELSKDETQIAEIHAKLDALKVHKLRKDHQKNKYREDIQNLQEGEAVILSDVKENVRLGPSANEVSRVFYRKQQRSVVGFIVWYKQNNKILGKKFIIISEVLSHDSTFIIKCFKLLLHSNLFQKLKINEIKFWSDGASYFRSFEHLHYLRHLKKKYSKIQASYFVENHGKCDVDALFGLIKNTLTEYESSSLEPITSTNQLVKVLQENLTRKSKSNENFEIMILPPYQRQKQVTRAKLRSGSVHISKKQINVINKEPEKKETLSKTRKTTRIKKNNKKQEPLPKVKLTKEQKKKKDMKRNFGKFNFTDCYDFTVRSRRKVHGRIFNDDPNYIRFSCTTETCDDTRKPVKINTLSPPTIADIPYFEADIVEKEFRRAKVTTSFPVDEESLEILREKYQTEMVPEKFRQVSKKDDAEKLAEDGIPKKKTQSIQEESQTESETQTDATVEQEEQEDQAGIWGGNDPEGHTNF